MYSFDRAIETDFYWDRCVLVEVIHRYRTNDWDTALTDELGASMYIFMLYMEYLSIICGNVKSPQNTTWPSKLSIPPTYQCFFVFDFVFKRVCCQHAPWGATRPALRICPFLLPISFYGFSLRETDSSSIDDRCRHAWHPRQDWFLLPLSGWISCHALFMAGRYCVGGTQLVQTMGSSVEIAANLPPSRTVWLTSVGWLL